MKKVTFLIIVLKKAKHLQASHYAQHFGLSSLFANKHLLGVFLLLFLWEDLRKKVQVCLLSKYITTSSTIITKSSLWQREDLMTNRECGTRRILIFQSLVYF